MSTPSAETLARVVKAYDVRGVVGDELDADLMRALGAAAAQVLATTGRFVVGRDMRPSSPELADAFIDGVTATGVDVVDIGLASTDGLYYASGALDAAGAMFTASHNPARFNGLKLCRPGAEPVAIDTGLGDIRDLAAAGGPPVATARGTRTHEDLTERFAVHVRSFVDVDALAGIHVAVDAGNGMAGHLWPAIVDGLAVVTEPLFFELDGTFPNHPANPLEVENLRDLQRAVTRGGHALGIAFDGDADRMFAVDERGTPVSSSLVGAVLARGLLARHPGATVLYNLICSRVVPETVVGAGGVAVRTRVGHSFVKRRMRETGAVFAVEHSGHYYFRDNYRADSGLIAALMLIEAVSRAGAATSALVAPYDRYPSSGELNFEVDDAERVLGEVVRAFAGRATVDHEDGVTVVTDGGWINVRPSNTEPLLRVNVEGDDEDALDRLVGEVVQLVSGASSAEV